ncbi:hypothetical protein J4714_14605 [Staphylococcus epidermidis]|nr:hypothetical protein [Staphylococcus epidermidis]
MRLDRTRTSRTISALIAKALVQKRAIAGDGRHALVQLTASGQALYEELFPKVQFINQQLLGDISEAQLQTRRRSLPRSVSGPRPCSSRKTFPRLSAAWDAGPSSPEAVNTLGVLLTPIA